MANIDNPVAEMAAEGFSRIALGVEYKGSRYCGWQRQ
ncbi:tRNA pseudouridine synthase, partial [Pseudomonas syringae pv. maculicola]